MYKEINLPSSIMMDTSSDKKVIRLGAIGNIVSLKTKIDKAIKFYKKNTKVLYFYLSDFSLIKDIYN